LSKNFLLQHNIQCVICEKTTTAWSYLASRNFPDQPNNIISVTGTDGKTSTCWFISRLLQALGKNTLLISTVGIFENDRLIEKNINTTMDSSIIHQYLHNFAQKYGSNAFAIVETTSIGLDQMRVEFVQTSVGICINIAPHHLDYHHTIEEYLAAKLHLGKLSKKFFVHKSIRQDKYPQYGSELIYAKQDKQLKIKLQFGNNTHEASLDLIGEFQGQNILSALIVLKEFFNIEELIPKLQFLTMPPGRMQKVSNNILVDFAHSSIALAAAIQTIRAMNPKRLIVIMGLPGDRDPSERPRVGKVLQEMADISIISNDNPYSEEPEAIANAIKATCPKGIIILDREAAIKTAINMLEPEDILLIAGKGHETTINFKDHKIDFHDAEVATRMLRWKMFY
jgi:UDP-N-acetylmuramoyl-L-alanyl-D-glutamate--2,6-diaminopimelate ligase